MQHIEEEHPSHGLDTWIEGLCEGIPLGKSARRVTRVLAASPSFASEASAARIAERAGVNAATVVRTARALGFRGWPDLQLEIKTKYLAFLDAHKLLELHSSSLESLTQKSLLADLAALQLLQRTLDETVITAAAESLTNAGRIGLLGSGSYIGPLMQFAHVGSRLGLSTVVIGREGRSVHVALAQLQEGDALLVVNLWRTPREIETIVHVASQMGIEVVLISDARTISLSQMASHTIVCPAEGASHFPSLSAATSIIHILLSHLTHLRGDKALEAMRYHESVYERLEHARAHVHGT